MPTERERHGGWGFTPDALRKYEEREYNMAKHAGRHVFTSESVSEGHPDTVADLISDAILDAYLKGDAPAPVA